MKIKTRQTVSNTLPMVELVIDDKVVAKTLCQSEEGPINPCNRLVRRMVEFLELPLDNMDAHRELRLAARICISKWMIKHHRDMIAGEFIQEVEEVIHNAC